MPPHPTHAVVIGVAGGSGSGKTTVVRRIVESLGSDQVAVVQHDRYYRDRGDLRLEERAALNYDHPDSLETDLLVTHLRELREGQAVHLPVYDFARHARTAATETAVPRRTIIVEGILIFTDAALRAMMDVKVFVDTDDDIRFIRRLQPRRGRARANDGVGDRPVPAHGQTDAPRLRRAEQALCGHHRPARAGTTRSRSTCC